MGSISRRVFLKGTGAGAVAAGLIASAPSLVGTAAATTARRHLTAHVPTAHRESQVAGGPLVVHIPDPRSDEVRLMVGTREVVRHDRALVTRLLRDAR